MSTKQSHESQAAGEHNKHGHAGTEHLGEEEDTLGLVQETSAYSISGADATAHIGTLAKLAREGEGVVEDVVDDIEKDAGKVAGESRGVVAEVASESKSVAAAVAGESESIVAEVASKSEVAAAVGGAEVASLGSRTGGFALKALEFCAGKAEFVAKKAPVILGAIGLVRVAKAFEDRDGHKGVQVAAATATSVGIAIGAGALFTAATEGAIAGTMFGGPVGTVAGAAIGVGIVAGAFVVEHYAAPAIAKVADWVAGNAVDAVFKNETVHTAVKVAAAVGAAVVNPVLAAQAIARSSGAIVHAVGTGLSHAATAVATVATNAAHVAVAVAQPVIHAVAAVNNAVQNVGNAVVGFFGNMLGGSTPQHQAAPAAHAQPHPVQQVKAPQDPHALSHVAAQTKQDPHALSHTVAQTKAAHPAQQAKQDPHALSHTVAQTHSAHFGHLLANHAFHRPATKVAVDQHGQHHAPAPTHGAGHKQSQGVQHA